MDWEKIITSPEAKMLGVVGAAGLLGGGANALAGSRDIRPRETKSERRKRILKDALIGGAVGSSAAGLLNFAGHQFSNAVPEDTALEKIQSDALQSGGVLAAAHGIPSIVKRVIPPLNFGRLAMQDEVAGLASKGGRVGNMAAKLLTPDKKLPSVGAVASNKEVLEAIRRRNPGVIARSGIHGSLMQKLRYKLMGGRRLPGGLKTNALITGGALAAPHIGSISRAPGNLWDSIKDIPQTTESFQND